MGGWIALTGDKEHLARMSVFKPLIGPGRCGPGSPGPDFIVARSFWKNEAEVRLGEPRIRLNRVEPTMQKALSKISPNCMLKTKFKEW